MVTCWLKLGDFMAEMVGMVGMFDVLDDPAIVIHMIHMIFINIRSFANDHLDLPIVFCGYITTAMRPEALVDFAPWYGGMV